MWFNVAKREYTTEEAEVAKWVKNGDEVDIYTWCNTTHCYVKAKFN